MAKLTQILPAWYQYIRGSTKTRQRMEKRLAVCEECEHKREVDGTGRVLLEFIGDERNLFKCGLCKCPLAALASLPQPACKAGKWNHIK